MAAIQCKKCGLKALRQAQRTACPACDTPYEVARKAYAVPQQALFDTTRDPSLKAQEGILLPGETIVPNDRKSNADDGEEAGATDSFTPFQASIISAMENILAVKYWEEARAIIEEQQEILLSIEGCAFLQELSAALHQQENHAIAEHIDMYLQVFEDAMEQNNAIESAWQRFQSELQEILDALKDLTVAMMKGDIRLVLEEKGKLLLSASTFAALYRGIVLTGAGRTDIGKSFTLFLRILYAAREGEIPTPEQLREILIEVAQEVKHKDGKITMMPGVPGVDINDPQTAALMQEMGEVAKEQPDLLLSFVTEQIRWSEPSASGLEAPQLQDEGIPHMRELTTQLLEHVSRAKQPHLWATLQNMLEALKLASPEQSRSSSADFLDYEPPFSFEEAPDQWGQAIVLIGFAAYRHSMGEIEKDTEQAIARFTKALSVFTYERHPIEWAAVLNVRGIAYLDRKEGEPLENTRLTLADLDMVLDSLEREEYPMPWAMTASLRCLAYGKLFYFTHERQWLERIITESETILAVYEQLGRPMEWAEALCARGIAYVECSAGEQQENIKLALTDFEAAAPILTRENDAEGWARLQTSMGGAYLSLFGGDRNQNLKTAITYFNAALSEFKRETSPLNWGRTMTNRGIAYNTLTIDDRKQNQENALADFDAALEVFRQQRMPIDWAKGHLNRGGLYLERIAGERRANYEHAVADCNNALQEFSRERAPVMYAVTRVNRGMGYRKLSLPEPAKVENDFVTLDEMFKRFTFTKGPAQFADTYMPYLTEYRRLTKLALEDFDEALTILTPEKNPREWAHACRVKATLGYGIWDFGTSEKQAAKYYEDALSVFTRQSMPVEWATTVNNRATYYLHLVLNGRREYVDQVLADLDASTTVFRREISPHRYRSSESMRAQIFMALERWPEAHEALLRVRAVERDLITSTVDNSAQFDTAAEFAPIDVYLRAAQVLLHLQRPQEAVVALEEGRARSLRIALDADTIDAQKITDVQARQRADDFFAARAVWRTLQSRAVEQMQSAAGDDSDDVAAVAQAHRHFLHARDAIRQYDNPDFMAPVPTWERIGQALSSEDEALVYLATDVQDGDAYGIALIVTQSKAKLSVATPIKLPRLTRDALSNLFEPLEKDGLLINVERAIQALGPMILDEVVNALHFWKIHRVRIIPYGRLGLFPLPSVHITLPDRTKRLFGELFEVTLVPSARALEIAHESMQVQRPNLFIAGNPQPLLEGWDKLLYAGAEAEVSFHLARKYGYQPATIHYLQPEEITRQNVIEELHHAWYAQLATHGKYNIAEPQNSQLILAGKEQLAEAERTISLRDALDGSVNLIGLRLLVLSSCATSVFDIRRAPNEVVGLAAGFLQAGAAGVLASLWDVGERATYLLMTRFVELYLDPHLRLSPAQALAQAQYWLRAEATNRLLSTYKPDLLAMVVNGLSDRHQSILARLHKDAAERDPDACMYADPEHWAAFVITGC
jgi:CHAT domain-containing protein